MGGGRKLRGAAASACDGVPEDGRSSTGHGRKRVATAAGRGDAVLLLLLFAIVH